MIGFIDTLYATLGTTGSYSTVRYFHTLQVTVTLTSVHDLHQSYRGNGFVTVSLSLRIALEVFAQRNFFLAIILSTAKFQAAQF
jgi:hypothetical protein